MTGGGGGNDSSKINVVFLSFFLGIVWFVFRFDCVYPISL